MHGRPQADKTHFGQPAHTRKGLGAARVDWDALMCTRVPQLAAAAHPHPSPLRLLVTAAAAVGDAEPPRQPQPLPARQLPGEAQGSHGARCEAKAAEVERGRRPLYNSRATLFAAPPRRSARQFPHSPPSPRCVGLSSQMPTSSTATSSTSTWTSSLGLSAPDDDYNFRAPLSAPPRPSQPWGSNVRHLWSHTTRSGRTS